MTLNINEETGKFVGYASIFHNIDKQNEIMLPGAFDDTDCNRVKLLWQHDVSSPIGRILQIYENDRGLLIEAKLLLEIKQAYEAYIMIKSGIINSLSIGYHTVDFDIEYKTGTKIIKSVCLMEVSLVTFPANEDAKILFLSNSEAEHPAKFHH